MKKVQSAGTSGDRQHRHRHQGERLGVGQRVEHLPLDSAQREYGQEREQHDRHREDDRPADGQAGRQARRRGRRRARFVAELLAAAGASRSRPSRSTNRPARRSRWRCPASDMALAWMSAMPSRRNTAMIRNEESAASGSVLRDDERRPDMQQDQRARKGWPRSSPRRPCR